MESARQQKSHSRLSAVAIEIGQLRRDELCKVHESVKVNARETSLADECVSLFVSFLFAKSFNLIAVRQTSRSSMICLSIRRERES